MELQEGDHMCILGDNNISFSPHFPYNVLDKPTNLGSALIGDKVSNHGEIFSAHLMEYKGSKQIHQYIYNVFRLGDSGIDLEPCCPRRSSLVA